MAAWASKAAEEEMKFESRWSEWRKRDVTDDANVGWGTEWPFNVLSDGRLDVFINAALTGEMRLLQQRQWRHQWREPPEVFVFVWIVIKIFNRERLFCSPPHCLSQQTPDDVK